VRHPLAAVLACAAPLLAPSLSAAQSSEESHRQVYERVVHSIVAVRALAPLGERSGSGVILASDGLILTSYAACPEGSSKIRVWVKGPRLYEAQIVGTSKSDELTLLRIKPREELRPIRLGSSGAVKVGEVSYTIGNAANSIILDDQPSLNVGIVSAVYRLNEERANSTYVGPVIETTAAVNVGMEGAPCLNASGAMVGFVTLNYSPNRFLGTAIPIDELKAVIERLKKPRTEAAEALPEGGEGYLGLKVKESGGKVVVEGVEADGPAARAGFGKGDVILEVANTRVKTEADFYGRLRSFEAGSVVWIRIEGESAPIKVVLEKKK
jgi:serine protease Do